MDSSEHPHAQNAKKSKIMFVQKKTQKQNIDELLALNDEQLFALKSKNDHEQANVLLAKIFDKIKQSIYISDRKRYYTYLSVYYANLAYFKLIQGQLEKTSTALENAILNFQHIKGFLSTRQQIIIHGYDLVRMYLQHCAILSQQGNHKTAYVFAEKGLMKIVECFRILKALCEQEIQLGKVRGGSIGKGNLKKIQKVCFKQIVLIEARTILEDLENLPEIHKLLSEQRSFYLKIMEQLYYWKNNLEINQRIIKKKLCQETKQQKRNLLGLQKGITSACAFNMGTLMSLRLRKLNLSFACKKFTLLSLEKIKEFALIASVCYFTAATETRFNEVEEDIESLRIVEKYETLSKNEQIEKCKILHLKAIEIAGKVAPQSKLYFDHLLNSFNKNYKLILDEIREEQSTVISTIQRRYCDLEQSDEASYQYGILSRNKVKKQQILFHEFKKKKAHHEGLKKRLFARVKSWEKLPGTQIQQIQYL